MAWTTPATWSAGATLTAAQLNEQVRDNLKAIGDPWTSFSPTFSGGISAIGNATVVARRKQTGKHVTGYVHLTVGSTTAFTGGTILITLPANHRVSNLPIGTAYFLDTTAGSSSRRGGTVITTATNQVFLISDDVAGSTVTQNVPFTWADGDTMAFSFDYEAA